MATWFTSTSRSSGASRPAAAGGHGVGTESVRASKRTGSSTGKIGYTYLHSALDDHSRFAYTEALDDEKAVTAIAFWHRAVAFFAAHGITPIRRCLTDNGACHRSTTWADALATTGTKHKRTKLYTPRTNGFFLPLTESSSMTRAERVGGREDVRVERWPRRRARC
ncbi:DDE-type integrase/transposase/recombinase [Streptomyces sp. NPDC051917]|uniref:DDE-type integrase/transposase/recombinase n=1 Tax=Streptomyces sp. NPDC051917 TaxID=3154754 RepID=UPI0034557F08